MAKAQASSAATSARLAAIRQKIRLWTLLALLAFLGSIVAYVGFVTAGGIWFAISDAMGLIQAITIAPVILGLDVLLKSEQPSLAGVGKRLGLVGCALVAVGSIVLLASDAVDQLVPAGGGLLLQFLGFGLIGAWFVVQGVVSRRTGLLGSRTTWSALTVGIGFGIALLGAPFGPDSIGTSLGAGIALIAFIAWAISIRKELAESG